MVLKPCQGPLKGQKVLTNWLGRLLKKNQYFDHLNNSNCTFRSDLKSSDWQTEIEGLSAVVRLVKYHPETILSDLNEVLVDLNHECKNLRSQVRFEFQFSCIL